MFGTLITWVTQLRACDSGLAVTNETLRPNSGVRCKYLKRSPEPSGEGQNYKERRDEVCGGLGRDKEALLATGRSAHLSWLPRSLSLCPAHNDCTLPSLPAASAPRPPDALLCIFSPKFASARVWASASRAAPTHNICVLFHPNLYPEIVLSCTRAGARCEPPCQCCQWYHPAVRTERRGPSLSSRLHGLLTACLTGLQSPDLLSASRRHFY